MVQKLQTIPVNLTMHNAVDMLTKNQLLEEEQRRTSLSQDVHS